MTRAGAYEFLRTLDGGDESLEANITRLGNVSKVMALIAKETERCIAVAEKTKKDSEESAHACGDHPCSCCEWIIEGIRSGA